MPSLRISLPSPRRLFTVLNLLRVSWILLLFYFEQYIYSNAIRTCTWPLSVPPENRLAVIADPQIVDDNTYPRRGLAMWVTQSVTDRYMRRNYQLLLKHQHPATIIFLGDLMDGGREWEDNKWLKEYNRFWNVFKTPEGVNVITTIPGNHDIGLGDGIQIDRLDRFKTHFTSVNRTSECFRLGAFDIVLLDSPSLLSEDPLVSEAQLTFLERAVTKLQLDAGRLLFTHIPLWRHADSNCGPQRESEKGIVMGGGYQYQNMLSEELSMKILDSCWPLTAIFSGDDHDYCVVNHTFEGRREKVPEYTVKSFSWAMGVRFPGYQLISLGEHTTPLAPTGQPKADQNRAGKEREPPPFATKPCILPSPLDAYVSYGIMAGISFVMIVLTHISHGRRHSYTELNKAETEVSTRSPPRRYIRIDVHGILRDCINMFIFVAICLAMQVAGFY